MRERKPTPVEFACWLAWAVLGIGSALYLWATDAWWKVGAHF